MAWNKISAEFAELYAKLVAPYPCIKKRMFGCQVFFVNDNMFTGIFEDGAFLRLMADDKEEIIRSNGEVAPFAPLGRARKEYVFVPDHLFGNTDFCGKWLKKSYTFVSSLPPGENEKQG